MYDVDYLINSGLALNKCHFNMKVVGERKAIEKFERIKFLPPSWLERVRSSEGNEEKNTQRST